VDPVSAPLGRALESALLGPLGEAASDLTVEPTTAGLVLHAAEQTATLQLPTFVQTALPHGLRLWTALAASDGRSSLAVRVLYHPDRPLTETDAAQLTPLSTDVPAGAAEALRPLLHPSLLAAIQAGQPV
jgi:hypothetical protein